MTDRVSLSDIESKLRGIGGDAMDVAKKASAPTLGAAAAAAVLAIAAVFLLGRRRGRKEAPVLEIRRI